MNVITASQFAEQMEAICGARLGSNWWDWRLPLVQQSPEMAYAVLTDWPVPAGHHQSELARSQGIESDSDEDCVVESDPAQTTEVDEKCGRLHYYQLHVLYSPNYQVPVLYFNGYTRDGHLLNAEEVWQDIPDSFKTHFQLSHISQGEHPVLGVPYYFVHPCNTAGLMALLHGPMQPQAPARDYLLHWLSWVSPMFQVPVPMIVSHIKQGQNIVSATSET